MARAAEKEGDELYEIKIQRASRFYRPRAAAPPVPDRLLPGFNMAEYIICILYIYIFIYLCVCVYVRRGVRSRLPELLTTSLLHTIIIYIYYYNMIYMHNICVIEYTVQFVFFIYRVPHNTHLRNGRSLVSSDPVPVNFTVPHNFYIVTSPRVLRDRHSRTSRTRKRLVYLFV